MSLLRIFIDSPLAASIGSTLIQSLWEGAIVSGSLAAVLAAARSPRVRYVAACAAMLMMLVGFAITFLFVMPQGAHQLPSHTQPPIQAWNINGNHGAVVENLTLAALVPWLAPFWITGVSLIYLRRAADCMSVRRLRTRGVCSAPERWQNEVARMSHRLRISRPILLLESSLADVPVVLGHFRPLILMPAGLLTGFPPEQIEAILLHELAHIRRHDFLVNIFQRLVEGLFFYHPAIWWISRVMRSERENCCDDVAVVMSGNAHGYASALAALEEFRHSVVEPAVAATGGSVVKRIRRLLIPSTTNGAWTPFLAATIFMIVAAVSVAAWQAEPSQAGSGTSQVQGQNAKDSAYARWINEDVVYIVNDAEKSAFLRLTSDAERDKFIEQFWARRDPTPGTPRNEYKEEHYRRVAYTNAHFAQSGTPGWQTDRGHIYVVYGPPDEIESHLSGNSQIPNAFEVWAYRQVKGIGNNGVITFVDQSGHGDFRLAPTTVEVK